MISGPKSQIPRGIESSDLKNLDYFPGRGNRRSILPPALRKAKSSFSEVFSALVWPKPVLASPKMAKAKTQSLVLMCFVVIGISQVLFPSLHFAGTDVCRGASLLR
jgi:hypothetical protein